MTKKDAAIYEARRRLMILVDLHARAEDAKDYADEAKQVALDVIKILEAAIEGE